MRTIPYPIALNGLTPKHVRDAFKRLTWEHEKSLNLRVCLGDMEQSTVDAYMQAKTYLRERTIADIAAPKTWWLICSLWNAKRMESVRAQFSPTSEHLADETELTPTSKDVLDVFATLFVIHLLSEGSPLRRLRALGNEHIIVEETPNQVAARERAEAREATTNAGMRGLINTARRDGQRVQFDARKLLGSVLTQKNEFVRIRCGDLITTIKRILLDEAALVLLKMPILYAYVEPRWHELPNHAQLCIRWSRGDGRTGGLNLHHDEVEYDKRGTSVKRSAPSAIDDSWCTVIEIPQNIPSVDGLGSTMKMRVMSWQQKLRESREVA